MGLLVRKAVTALSDCFCVRFVVRLSVIEFCQMELWSKVSAETFFGKSPTAPIFLTYNIITLLHLYCIIKLAFSSNLDP